MRLKRGAKYGLLGANDSGKTTLMRAIANGSVEGFPDPATVRTVFVEADILGELSHLSCVDYIMEDPKLAGLDRDEVLAVMATVGFREDGKAKPHHAVSTLSGGWRMKLAMARAMLQVGNWDCTMVYVTIYVTKMSCAIFHVWHDYIIQMTF